MAARKAAPEKIPAPTSIVEVKGVRVDLDPYNLDVDEGIAVEKAVGESILSWVSPRTFTQLKALVWVQRCRAEPNLRWEDVSFKLSDITDPDSQAVEAPSRSLRGGPIGLRGIRPEYAARRGPGRSLLELRDRWWMLAVHEFGIKPWEWPQLTVRQARELADQCASIDAETQKMTREAASRGIS